MKPTAKLFDDALVILNVGLSRFAEDLHAHGHTVVHVDWKPPAGGKPELLAILERIRRMERALERQEAES